MHGRICDTKHSQLRAVDAKKCGNLAIRQKILQFRTINLSSAPFYGSFQGVVGAGAETADYNAPHQASSRYILTNLTEIKQVYVYS